jgi:hypothetical protein
VAYFNGGHLSGLQGVLDKQGLPSRSLGLRNMCSLLRRFDIPRCSGPEEKFLRVVFLRTTDVTMR